MQTVCRIGLLNVLVSGTFEIQQRYGENGRGGGNYVLP